MAFKRLGNSYIRFSHDWEQFPPPPASRSSIKGNLWIFVRIYILSYNFCCRVAFFQELSRRTSNFARFFPMHQHLFTDIRDNVSTTTGFKIGALKRTTSFQFKKGYTGRCTTYNLLVEYPREPEYRLVARCK
jgi:hypothetical protein